MSHPNRAKAPPSAPAARPKAYSYLRFSTPEQTKGDSQRRQLKLAQDYAERHGLDLDTKTTYADLGVSAFRAKNAEAGRLNDFLEAVEGGIVPQGSYLLVESLDRVSRTKPRKAVRILERICEAGVNVVTLSDNKVYNEDNLDNDGGMSLIMSILIFIRANEESTMKASRLKAAWEAKRTRAANGGETITTVMPAWIERGPDGKPRLIEERAEVVRGIFNQYAAGTSVVGIIRALNGHNIETFGHLGGRKATQWHASYIQKILRNPAVVGTFQPMTVEYDKKTNRRVRKEAGEPIKGYYPPVIDEALWQKVCAMVADTQESLRGRAANTDGIQNLLGGLGVCRECGATMTRVSKGGKPGNPSYSYFVCVKGKYGKGCPYKAASYAAIESSFLRDAPALFADPPASATEVDQTLGHTLRITENALDVLEERHKRLRDLVIETGDRSFMADMDAVGREIEEHNARRKGLQGMLEASSDALVAVRMAELREALGDTESNDGRKRVNALLRAVLSGAIVDTKAAEVRLVWKNGGTATFVFGMPAE